MIGFVLAGAGALLGGTWLYNKMTNPGIAQPSPIDPGSVPLNLVGGVQIPSDDWMFTGPADDISTWPVIELNGEHWRVAPSPIGPVGIGQARDIAESRGLELPTPALVDAIWRNADLRVAPIPEASDGTPKTMDVPEVFLKHKKKIDAEIDGRSFQLLAGTHKDIVIADVAFPGLKKGAIGLYGWHAAADMLKDAKDASGNPVKTVGGAVVHAPVTQGEGFVIQQPFGGHGLEWRDYSQSVRLVKKVT